MCGVENRVELGACGDARGEPAVASEGVRQLGVAPGGDVVAGDRRVVAEQPLDQVAVVVVHKDDRPQPEPSELADQARRVDDPLGVGAQAKPVKEDAGQLAGAARGGERRGDGVSGGRQRRRVAPRPLDRRAGPERRAVGEKRHVDRAAVIERRLDQPLGLGRDVLRRHQCPGGDDRLGHSAEELEAIGAKGVVHPASAPLRRSARHADEVEDRQVFGVSLRDAVSGPELAHPESGADRGDAADPGIAVCGVSGVQLVGAADPA